MINLVIKTHDFIKNDKFANKKGKSVRATEALQTARQWIVIVGAAKFRQKPYFEPKTCNFFHKSPDLVMSGPEKS